MDGLSYLQNLDFGGQPCVKLRNLRLFLGLFEALPQVGIDHVLSNVLCCPDLIDSLVRQEPTVIIMGVHSFCDIVCGAKNCRLDAHGG